MSLVQHAAEPVRRTCQHQTRNDSFCDSLCDPFFTLRLDVNGHLFAWGRKIHLSESSGEPQILEAQLAKTSDELREVLVSAFLKGLRKSEAGN